MNLRQLKYAFDMADGDLCFVIDDSTKDAIRKKLTSPPLLGQVDIHIKKRNDGREIVYLPKSKKNIYAFTHLLVIDPKENAPIIPTVPIPDPKPEPERVPLTDDSGYKPMSVLEDFVIPVRGESKKKKESDTTRGELI